MQDGLWVVILVVGIFMGILMGYSLPPMYETGLIGGDGEQAVGIKSDVNSEMDQYYKDLLKQTE